METPIHVVHLEDDAADARLVASTLKDAGLECQFIRVRTRDEFEGVLLNGRPDIILADSRLPAYDGMSALHLTREHRPTVPFIFVSGAMGEETAIEALTQGATDYVLKNNLVRLALAVKRALTEAHNKRENERLQAALKASDARHKDLYENAPDMHVSVNAHSALVENCNQTLADMLGLSKTDIIGRPVFDLYHPDCQEQAQKAFNTLLETGTVQDEVLQLIKKDGTPLDVSLNVSAVRDQSGAIVSSRSTLRDITQWRRNEMIHVVRLRLMQFAVTHSLADLFEETINEAERVTGSQIGFYVLVDDDQEHLTLQTWSTRTRAKFCRAQGQGLHHVIADAGVWLDCLHQRRPVIHNDYASLPHRKGLPEGHAEMVRELVVPVVRGEKITAVLGVGNKQTDYTQKDVAAITLLADLAWEISERKQAEQQVSLMSFALNEVQEGAYLIDRHARFHYVNDASCRMLGYGRDELMDLDVAQVDPDFPMHRWARHWTHLKETRTTTFESRHRTRDGSVIPVEINANYFEYNGQTYSLSLVRDITERKQMECERLANLRFFENMDKVNRAIQQADSPETMMMEALEEVLSIFDAERVFLLYPCDPEAETWTVPMECSQSGHAGPVHSQHLDVPMAPSKADHLRDLLAADGPLTFGRGNDRPLSRDLQKRHGFRSLLTTALYPTVGKPWQFGIHQCSAPRAWTPEEKTLMREIGRRLSDGLSSLLNYRDLRESETFLNNIVENIPNMICVKDARDMSFVRINKSGEQLLGFSREEMLGKTEYDLFPLEEANRLAAKDRRILNGKVLVDIPEETITTRSNAKRILNTKKIPMLNEAGVSQYLLGISEDITERKQAEESIRKLSQAIEQSPVSIVITDTKGSIEFVNAQFTQITGYAFDEAIGRNPRFMKSGKTPAEVYRQLWKTIGRGGIWRGEFRNRKKSGDLFWEHATIAPVRNAENRITHYVAVKEDITQRKLAEEALQEKQAFIRNILDSVDEGFIVVDGQYRIRSANRAFCKMVRATEAEVIGRPCHEGIRSAVRPCFDSGSDCPVRQTFATGKARFTTHIHEDPSGKNRHVELRTYPIHDASGTVVSVIETFTDVTEKRRLEDQLVQVQKMDSVGRLAGGVAHDFNNMLGVILGHAQLALVKLGPDHPLHHHLKEILDAADRSGNLTRQLLAFARQQVVTPKVLDLNKTVDGMLKMLGRLIGEDLNLVWKPGESGWTVKMDPVQIDQILVNLCVNARDAISGVGTLTIETGNASLDRRFCAENPGSSPGDFLVLSVSDDGHGMDKATMDKIFEPFFTTKAFGKGTGLGLATVYGIVKQNGGFISVDSKPGSGTKFRIYLLRHLEQETPPEIVFDVAPISRNHETILLVEDAPAILNIATMMLEHLGYRVLPAASPNEAMAIAGEYKGGIHLLLTDVVMPEMNGRELASQLHALYPSMRLLFMSGYTGDVIARRGVLDEGVEFIQKPFTIHDLSAKLMEIMGND